MEKREAYIIQPQGSEFIVFWLLNVILNERERKKRVIEKKANRKQIRNLWNAYAFEEPIVYRICAPARKHVNQLNSTRFPNVIKKYMGNVGSLTVETVATTMITEKKSSVRHANIACCIVLLSPGIYSKYANSNRTTILFFSRCHT